LSKVAVIGTGYVGLTTAVGLANLGHDVIGYDIDIEKLKNLEFGKISIYEPGLDELVQKVLKSGNFSVTIELSKAVSDADFIFTCVPTPQDEDGSADLSYVLAASNAIKDHLKPSAIVITKSTVPVGSATRIEKTISRSDVFVVSNPEFLREGAAVYDFQNPDRIVVGSKSPAIGQKVMDLYQQIDCQKIITSQTAAELIKYASNSFLAIKLSFVNDIAALCEVAGADVQEVMNGIGLDSRIGNKFMNPGPGWGGSCFPKDTKALVSIANNFGMAMPLIDAALESNEKTHKRVADRIMSALDGSLVGSTIGVLGLAFKANTDDTRESPAIAVIERLIGRGAKVKAFDPIVKSYSLDGLQISKSAIDACHGADALLVLTEWDEFKSLDAKKILSVMNQKFVVDTRNILNKQDWESAGAIFPSLKAQI